MKDKVSPAAAVVAIIVALAIVGFFGFRLLAGNRSGVSDGAKPTPAAQTERMNQQYQNYGSQRGGGTPYGGSGSPYSNR